MRDLLVPVALMLTTPGWRGSGISFVKIARGLAARGHDVLLVAGEASVAERLAEVGVPVHLVETRDTGRREVAAVRRLLARHGTRIVLADAPRDVRIARYASLFRRRAIAWRYNLGHRDVPPDPLQRFLFGGLGAVIQQSEHGIRRLREGMPWLTPRRIELIPNGYEIDEFPRDPEAGRAWRATRGIDADRPMVLTAGALVPEKDTAIVAEALRGLDAEWVVAGDGPERAALEARAAALGLRATFVGRLPAAELHDAMRGADLVVQPSAIDLFPNIVAEAMALGCAVVGSDRGTTPEVVGDAGVTMDLGDPVAASRIIGALLEDAAARERLGRMARERIARVFPLEAMLDGFDRVVRSLA